MSGKNGKERLQKRDSTDGTKKKKKNQAERFKEDNDQECERWMRKIEGRRVKNETWRSINCLKWALF